MFLFYIRDISDPQSHEAEALKDPYITCIGYGEPA